MATILLETQRGTPVVIEGNAAAPGYPARATDRLELIGDIGSITLEGSSLRLDAAGASSSACVDFDLESAYQASFDAAIAHFADALRHHWPFETDGADNLATLALVDAAYDLAARATSVREN
jgi:predicted dehydrogenase